MKRWAALTVLLYVLMLMALTVPGLLFYGLKFFHGPARAIEQSVTLKEALETYQSGAYWIWLGIMTLAEAALLLVPLRVSDRRLRPTRPLLVPVATTALLLANLVLAGVCAIGCVGWGDHFGDVFEAFGNVSRRAQQSVPVLGDWFASLGFTTDFYALTNVVGIIAALWGIWALIFYRFAHADDPHALTRRAVKWLLRGSILELLVAVPSHVIVRSRDECCAPAGTFWGIASGLSVMLLAFGPGVFFLFVERMNRLRPRPPEPPPVQL